MSPPRGSNEGIQSRRPNCEVKVPPTNAEAIIQILCVIFIQPKFGAVQTFDPNFGLLGNFQVEQYDLGSERAVVDAKLR